MRRTYVYDKERKEMVEVHRERIHRSPTIMVDAYANNPIKSPVDGRVLDNRYKVKEHNKINNVVDVGNDGVGTRESKPQINPNQGLREDLHRAYSDLDA